MSRSNMAGVVEALACVYSGAGRVEAEALLDALRDRGLDIVISLDDDGLDLTIDHGSGYPRRLDEQIVKVTAARWPDEQVSDYDEGLDYHGIDEDRELPAERPHATRGRSYIWTQDDIGRWMPDGCTGYVSGDGLQHDGATCPIHEAEVVPDA